jgi:hypothetical protein
MTLERCRDASDEPAMVVGEKAATVGGLESRRGDDAPLSERFDGGDMESIHGDSERSEQADAVSKGAKEEVLRWTYQELPCTNLFDYLTEIIAGVRITRSSMQLRDTE